MMVSVFQGYIKTVRRNFFGNAALVISGWRLLSALRSERVGVRFAPATNLLGSTSCTNLPKNIRENVFQQSIGIVKQKYCGNAGTDINLMQHLKTLSREGGVLIAEQQISIIYDKAELGFIPVNFRAI